MKTLATRLEKGLMFAALALGLLAAAWQAAAAEPRSPAQAVCGARPAVLATLDGKYAETPAAMGLAANGTVVEVLSSADGSWTIIMTAPNGVSCLLAAGEYWQVVPKPVAELTL